MEDSKPVKTILIIDDDKVYSEGIREYLAARSLNVLVMNTSERGVPPITTTQFPQPPGMGSSWNPELVRQPWSPR